MARIFAFEDLFPGLIRVIPGVFFKKLRIGWDAVGKI
jgi:hypothetical protein